MIFFACDLEENVTQILSKCPKEYGEFSSSSKKHERSRYVNLENIPEYLKENARWCLWKYEIRNNKKTKIPINPTTGG